MSIAKPAPSVTKASPVFGRMRGRVLVMLCFMYAISYVDRTNISTATLSIQHDLGLNDSLMGIVLGAFSIPYALLQIFGGNIGERLGPRKALTWIGLLWGVATIATGFSIGFFSLVGARLLLGLTESAAFPTATQAMSRWIPRDRNGFAQGVVHSASRLATAAAPLIVAALIVWGGWRSSFLLVGVLSLVWAVIWVTLFRNRPMDYPKITEQELSELPAYVERVDRPAIPWGKLLRTLAPVAFVDFAYGWTFWVFITWLPSFLGTNFHLSLSTYALYTSLILLAGVLGDTVGGVLSDRLLRYTGNLRFARRTTLLIGIIGSLLCLVPLLFVQTLTIATVSLCLSLFFLELTVAPLWSIPMDVAPQWAGTASGVMNTGFGIAGIFSPIVFGATVQYFGWQWPFAASIALLVGAAIVAAKMNPRSLVIVDDVTATPSASS
jgi:MFS family permease